MDNYGCNGLAVHDAVMRDDPSVILRATREQLLSKDLFGDTVLHRAAFYGKEGLGALIVQRLHEKCVTSDELLNNDGDTPASVAKSKGHDEAAFTY